MRTKYEKKETQMMWCIGRHESICQGPIFSSKLTYDNIVKCGLTLGILWLVNDVVT